MDDLYYLISLLTTDDCLQCGHDHTNTTPAGCITTVLEPEDTNHGDEAFCHLFLDEDFVETVSPEDYFAYV
ncbi:MAG: hypothetical protein HXX17_07965 [Geobacteraceae bacterium]|nr:hypothetical protein [Geobacteraceae bacterium]